MFATKKLFYHYNAIGASCTVNISHASFNQLMCTSFYKDKKNITVLVIKK